MAFGTDLIELETKIMELETERRRLGFLQFVGKQRIQAAIDLLRSEWTSERLRQFSGDEGTLWQTSFTLDAYSNSYKIAVIGIIRKYIPLGLAETKWHVENLPHTFSVALPYATYIELIYELRTTPTVCITENTDAM
ncbi:MAG: hypothetical protein LBN02_06485 [Oscillospiraceae bacterium]|jgi:hypothetical protein|nr:hypothetical protein [Oscillospiraceae bacterium]